MPIVRIDKLLKSGADQGLDSIVKRAKNMGELTHILQQSLDADVAPALKAANLRGDGELVLLCASSSWAARLRFEADRLVAAAKAAGLDVQRCRVAVCRDR